MNSDRDLMQMALDALEKLSNETPTTHVRVGKAKTVDGKEIVALWFDDCSDPLQQAVYINATKPEKLKGFLKQVRDRLAQPEPEPVAWVVDGEIKVRLDMAGKLYYSETNVYTAPPKREWVGFTAAERDEIVPMLVQSLINHDDKTMAVLLRAILIDVEERLKEKNT